MLAQPVQAFLNAQGVHYDVIPHPAAYTACETAEAAHVSGRALAKAVVVRIDGKLALAVLPATKRLDFDRLQQAAQAERVERMHEWGFGGAFPGCEPGAVPPIGQPFGMPVFADESLAKGGGAGGGGNGGGNGAGELVFNGGTHTDLVRMSFDDFRRVARPKLAPLAVA